MRSGARRLLPQREAADTSRCTRSPPQKRWPGLRRRSARPERPASSCWGRRRRSDRPICPVVRAAFPAPTGRHFACGRGDETFVRDGRQVVFPAPDDRRRSIETPKPKPKPSPRNRRIAPCNKNFFCTFTPKTSSCCEFMKKRLRTRYESRKIL